MATELKQPYVIPCTAAELDEVIENNHMHLNKNDLDAIGTAALLNAGTAAGNVPVIESSGKLPGAIIPADDTKVDKVEGKSLSTEDYTTAEKTKLAGIEAGANKYVHPSSHPMSMITELSSALDGKVDKVDGKSLSTEDYTTAEKTKLAGIAADANNYVHPSTHPSTMITGLGTAAAKDTGTSAGNVPVLGSDGKLADEVLPEIPSPTIVYNGLDSESTTDALSAAQGKILADQIDGLTASDITYEGDTLNSALLTLDSRVLAAQTDAQGALAGITSLQTTIGDIGTILDDINGEVV